MPRISPTDSPSQLKRPPLAGVQMPAGCACGACGAPVDPRDRYCGSCGTPRDEVAAPPTAINKSDATIDLTEPLSTIKAPAASSLKTFHCQNCGAEITVEPTQRSYICPFCDSTYVIELELAPGRQRPEFVLGFAITPQQAWETFATWTKRGSWFRPLDLRQVKMPEKMRGVYLPFWSFSMLGRAAWQAQIGEYWYRTETYSVTINGKTETRTRQVQETEWWPLAGKFQHYYFGYLISGSKGLSQDFADQLQPYHLAGVKRFEPSFLAGWSSEEYSLEREEAEQNCRAEFSERMTNDIAAFLPGDRHAELTCDISYEHVNSDLLLLPVYIMSYQYRGKVWQFVLNGQTGKYYGERPFSWTRLFFYILMAILLGVAIGLGFKFAGN